VVKLLQDPPLRQGWARQPDKNTSNPSAGKKPLKRLAKTYLETG